MDTVHRAMSVPSSPLWVALVYLSSLVMCSQQSAGTSAPIAEVGNGSSTAPCTIDDPGSCPEGMVCDAFRKVCVPAATGANACAGVSCPPGTECVANTGRCGRPLGNGCHDLGTAWWSGQAEGPPKDERLGQPTPRVFKVVNSGSAPVHLKCTPQGPVAFALHWSDGKERRELEIPENHFCPTPCPDKGPILEVDCGAPRKSMLRLAPGAMTLVTWSGTEEVLQWRHCGGAGIATCYVRRSTAKGDHELGFCAHKAITDGVPSADNADLLTGARPSDEAVCTIVSFTHPAQDTVLVKLSDR